MDDKTINIRIDEIKKELSLLQVGEVNLDNSLKTKINAIEAIQTDVTNLNNNKLDKAQGIAKANKNVVTDADGNIATENKPTIPTVNNGTLTIQKNGVDVTSFSANNSSNVTANIVVPTSASDFSDVVPTSRTINGKALSADISLTSSDVGALSSSTSYAANLAVSSNKLQLKDQNNLGIGSEIDIVQGVTLNGTSTKTPSFYAPTTAGTSGQILKSNGSGAPTWQEAPSGIQVFDGLTSSSATTALSANQGRVLDSAKADKDAANITSYYVPNWQEKLNNLATPSLTDGSPHLITGQAVVVESYLSSDKKTWYRKWSDGWKECGSAITDDLVYAQKSVTLPLSFSNAYYSLVFAPSYNSSGQLWSSYLTAKSTTAFTITYYTNKGKIGSWYASGY